ncbi:MAG: hypothetical protein ABIH26_01910 [Candidatus Eisenbacteria bacterium]
MIRRIVPAGLLLLLLAGPAFPGSADWVRIETWEGREIALAGFGFYECSNWDVMHEFQVDRKNVSVVYGGARTRIPIEKIRSISQDPPVFAGAFCGMVIEMVDGLRFRCEMVPEISGVVGVDQVGEVRIPGRRIRSIEFIRRGSEGGGAAGGESEGS